MTPSEGRNPEPEKQSETTISVRSAEWKKKLTEVSQVSRRDITSLVVECLEVVLPLIEQEEKEKAARLENRKAKVREGRGVEGKTHYPPKGPVNYQKKPGDDDDEQSRMEDKPLPPKKKDKP